MSAIERQKYLQQVTKTLTIFTGAVLLIVFAWLYTRYGTQGNRHSYLVLLVFTAGLLGGFVSIQQRLPKMKLDELKSLSSSWFSIILMPINGGVFSLVLMLMFIGNIVQGTLFPEYPERKIIDLSTFIYWLDNSYPDSGADVTKLLFWSFVAGFSERFVPQIINRTIDDSNSNKPSTDEPENISNDSEKKNVE
jgi:hypothetical protein